MKTYELVIERKQPTCGGRAPTKSEIQTVTTEDPVAYVRELEPNGNLEVETTADSVTVTLRHNDEWIRYEFTED